MSLISMVLSLTNKRTWTSCDRDFRGDAQQYPRRKIPAHLLCRPIAALIFATHIH
jgi:hypothetical protein